MERPEIDVINNTILFCVFFLGIFIGLISSMLVAAFNERKSREYEDRA